MGTRKENFGYLNMSMCMKLQLKKKCYSKCSYDTQRCIYYDNTYDMIIYASEKMLQCYYSIKWNRRPSSSFIDTGFLGNKDVVQGEITV